MKAVLRHWLKFNAVGVAGVVAQLMMLALLKGVFGAGYLVATFVAVETAILHNFFWHERWTWADRTRNVPGVAGRLVRFNLTNGVISLAGNLVLMWLFVSQLRLHYLLANMIAIVLCSLFNFMVSDRLVFHSSAR